MDPVGRHAVIDGTGVRAPVLNNPELLKTVLADACRLAGATVLKTVVHRFTPSGVTVCSILAESHASIHTYPEAGAYMADVFTCGSVQPDRAARHIADSLGGSAKIRTLDRGTPA